MKENEIYEKAILLWGKRAQMNMMVEEAMELIQALMKYHRCRVTDDDVINEMVDVQIMLNQMKIVMNDDSKYNRMMAFKLDRLQQRVERDEHK